MTTIRVERDPAPALLWVGILGPPIFWALRIAGAYILVPYACWWDLVWVVHLITVLSLVATAGAGGGALYAWRMVGGGFDVDAAGTRGRARFMALFGMCSAGLFLLVIAAEGMAPLFIDPCQTASRAIG